MSIRSDPDPGSGMIRIQPGQKGLDLTRSGSTTLDLAVPCRAAGPRQRVPAAGPPPPHAGHGVSCPQAPSPLCHIPSLAVLCRAAGPRQRVPAAGPPPPHAGRGVSCPQAPSLLCHIPSLAVLCRVPGHASGCLQLALLLLMLGVESAVLRNPVPRFRSYP
jgi:hypothetical protein